MTLTHSHIAAPTQIHSGLRHKAYYYALIMLFSPWIAIQGFGQRNLEVGLFGGDAYYLGDLNPDVHFRAVQIAYGAFARYNIDERWALKFGATETKVKGNSGKTNFLPGRDLSFVTPITDFSLTGEFNFFNYFTGSKYSWITPYIYAGLGFFFFNPTSGGVKLRPLGTEGQNKNFEGRKPYSTTGISIPFGLGVKVSLGRRFAVTAFWEMHKTFTDYIDDVSTTYYLVGPVIDQNNPGEILSDPTKSHLPGMQRGNPKNYDWYSFSGLTVSYKLNLVGSRKCKDNTYHN